MYWSNRVVMDRACASFGMSCCTILLSAIALPAPPCADRHLAFRAALLVQAVREVLRERAREDRAVPCWHFAKFELKGSDNFESKSV